MRCDLTETNRVDPGRGHVAEYRWRGRAVGICDSARNVVAVVSSFNGPDQAWRAVTEKLFLDFDEALLAAACEPGDLEDNLADLICSALWDVCGLDATPDRRHSAEWEEPRFSWEQDAHRIRASLLAAYGLDWDECADRMSFSQMCGLIAALMETPSPTPIQQAVLYRGEPPEHVRKSDALMDSWRACAAHYALDGGESVDAMAAADAAMADMFAAAERAAGRG